MKLRTSKLLALMVTAFIYSGCGPEAEKHPAPVKCAEVYAKKESTETRYKHVFSWYKGDFVLQPEVRTVYYLLFTDGTHARVDMDTWAITEVGDKVQAKYPFTPCQAQ
jgi:hypothetical protein